MKFLMGLPNTLEKNNSIWIIMKRLTKFTHFIPVRVDYNSQQLAKILYKGYSEIARNSPFIILECDIQFTSKFWDKLYEELDNQYTFSIIFHS